MPRPNRVILVVEDTAVIRMLAVELLVEAGFEVLEAESADEAIHILQGRPDIHLVFTDVHMPGTMDGIKLSHYIRDRWAPVKLIVASGKAIVDESQLPMGARFFTKPYDGGKIVAAIIGMLPEATGDFRATS
jgi:CheY-like chemotaxis protein